MLNVQNGAAHVSPVTAAFSGSVHSSPAHSYRHHTDTAAVRAEKQQINVELGSSLKHGLFGFGVYHGIKMLFFRTVELT